MGEAGLCSGEVLWSWRGLNYFPLSFALSLNLLYQNLEKEKKKDYLFARQMQREQERSSFQRKQNNYSNKKLYSLYADQPKTHVFVVF